MFRQQSTSNHRPEARSAEKRFEAEVKLEAELLDPEAICGDDVRRVRRANKYALENQAALAAAAEDPDNEEALAALLSSVGSGDSIRSEDASEVEDVLRANAATVLYSLSPDAAQQDIRVLQVKSMQNATSNRVAEWVTQHGVDLDFVIYLHHTVMHLSASMFISPSDMTKDAIMSAVIEDLDTEDQEAIATMQASALLLDLIDELGELAAMTHRV